MGYTKQRHSGNRKNVESADKVFKKQTLEPLTPQAASPCLAGGRAGILGPSSPTKLEKNQKYKQKIG